MRVCGLWMETLRWHQIYFVTCNSVIMSQENSGAVAPEVFALLQRKTQASYEYQ